ncbi:hypothetical protein [Massilia horti]|uniref:Exported signal peptide protein n=1 Tax=Massilia horti TaxID=2562153 RepID=A0A4Y9T800_9BURK|nr:hypothetical protein [Massilia horti]TFW33629.1 hypothetical protein E4O92_06445 [Massilia horti]
MATTLKQLLAACTLLLAAGAFATPASANSSDTPSKTAAHKANTKPKAKAKAKKTEPAEPTVADDPEPDVTGSVSTEYDCEQGNKITIYTSDKDDAHIALRWKKHLHQLDRVGTTTGAQRFENSKTGLIWIGIPAKGILLDSKHNRQLANECKSATQSASAGGSSLEKKS